MRRRPRGSSSGTPAGTEREHHGPPRPTARLGALARPPSTSKPRRSISSSCAIPPPANPANAAPTGTAEPVEGAADPRVITERRQRRIRRATRRRNAGEVSLPRTNPGVLDAESGRDRQREVHPAVAGVLADVLEVLDELEPGADPVRVGDRIASSFAPNAPKDEPADRVGRQRAVLLELGERRVARLVLVEPVRVDERYQRLATGPGHLDGRRDRGEDRVTRLVSEGEVEVSRARRRCRARRAGRRRTGRRGRRSSVRRRRSRRGDRARSAGQDPQRDTGSSRSPPCQRPTPGRARPNADRPRVGRAWSTVI